MPLACTRHALPFDAPPLPAHANVRSGKARKQFMEFVEAAGYPFANMAGPSCCCTDVPLLLNSRCGSLRHIVF